MKTFALWVWGLFTASLVWGDFIPNEDISPCFGLICENGGRVDEKTCFCDCAQGYGGHDCSQALKKSDWPSGNYGLLSTFYGCPETDGYGWLEGYINITYQVSDWQTNYQAWPESLHLLGPYSWFDWQINFCMRLDVTQLQESANNRSLSSCPGDSHDESTDFDHLWPLGHYCILQGQGCCPQGFVNSSILLAPYLMRTNDGYLPSLTYDLESQEVKLHTCCRSDGNQEDEIKLSFKNAFYLLKESDSPCPIVAGTEVAEEIFTATGNSTLEESLQDQPKNTSLFTLNLCFYTPYDRRECIYAEDSGASYRGREKEWVTGLECDRWDQGGWPYTDELYLLTDLEDNYCRTVTSTWAKPGCMTGGRLVYCYIDECNVADDLPDVAAHKLTRANKPEDLYPPWHAVDQDIGSLYQNQKILEPWLQIDLVKYHHVEAVIIHRTYDKDPFYSRRTFVFVSRRQWDFLAFGAGVCNGPFDLDRLKVFRFQCVVPIIGRYVTIQNIVASHPSIVHDKLHSMTFELTEVKVKGKAIGCGLPLGMVSGSMRDFQISSSTDITRQVYAYNARLHDETGWCANEDMDDHFIQVDLLTPMLVQGVEVQGWMSQTRRRLPDSFTLYHGMIGTKLNPYLDGLGEIKVFKLDDSMGPEFPQLFLLSKPILTRIVRLYLSGTPCLKMELIGCPKQVIFDLTCPEKTTRAGLQRMAGHMLLNKVHSRHFELPDVLSWEMCNQLCKNLKVVTCGSFNYIRAWSSCTLIPIATRYLHYLRLSWDKGFARKSLYGQEMCISEIQDKEACKREVHQSGIITSPAFPMYYGEDLDCVWQIRFPQTTFVKMDIVDLVLPEPETVRLVGFFKAMTSECGDQLIITDSEGGELIRATGTNYKQYEGMGVFSLSNAVDVRLKSCFRLSQAPLRSGYRIEVTVSDCGSCGYGSHGTCSSGASCSAPCGYISSPFFPQPYASSLCEWRIMGSWGQYVRVSFLQLDVIGGNGDCTSDNVVLYDYNYQMQRELKGRYCKSNRPVSHILSKWHRMDVEFFSNSEEHGRGFQLKYLLVSIDLDAGDQNVFYGTLD